MSVRRIIYRNLQGPAGPKGDTGDAGPQGEPGLTVVSLTEAEYEALTAEEQNDPSIWYAIVDEE